MSKPSASTKGTSDRTDRREPVFRYSATLAHEIEMEWQAHWEQQQTFRVPNPGEEGFDASKPKFYCLDMYPYPSGAGLHVGHPEGYTATDIVSRYKRLKGFNVLHPMGWDAFGLPAEQYAITTGVHPAITTRNAIDTFRRQLKRFGFSYDWSREFATIDEDYYRWTQWIWLKAYHAWYDTDQQRARPIDELLAALRAREILVGADDAPVRANGDETHPDARSWSALGAAEQRRFIDAQRLAYLDEQMVNWCPKLGTALANEEVTADGLSERGHHPVYRKPLRQWMYRITAFADRLLEDLDHIDWPDSTAIMEREWIGRSTGAEVDFPLADAPDDPSRALRVYTTRPDTLFGATFMVVAPEHHLIEAVLARPTPETDVRALRRYVQQARNRTDIDRMAESREKTGVFTGAYAINPVNGGRVPIWTADYVLMGYGHGAIMAVPAHDERDYEFAKTFGLPIIDVVHTPAQRAIRACCQRLREAGIRGEGVLPALADFVGLSVNRNAIGYDEVWKTVRGRRNLDVLAQPPGDGQDRRGLIASVWAETLMPWVRDDPGAFISATCDYRLADVMGNAIVEPGLNVNSSNDEVSINGLPTAQAIETITRWLQDKGLGRHKVNYRLRDWLFSRQRYWGEPFPIVYDANGDHYPVDEANLPVVLPPLEDYEPIESDEPLPMLAKATGWVSTTAGEAGVSPALLPPDTPVERETNTMPTWAGSCWYYLRYCDPKNPDRFMGREADRYWMLSPKRPGEDSRWADGYDPARHRAGGVDLYLGGSEYANTHLLYTRFWHRLLYDLGELSTPEPFHRLFHQGLITSFAYQRADKSLVPADQVVSYQIVPRGEDEPEVMWRDGLGNPVPPSEVEINHEGHAPEQFIEKATGQKVTQVIAKMSKSLKNVINPDDVIAEYGADSFRLYEMYMGPLEATKPWDTRAMVGGFRFLQRIWRLAVDEDTGELQLSERADEHIERLLHRTIAKVGEDIERLAFNTAIAAMIEFLNQANKSDGLTAGQLERFALILSPFAPHLAEELWSKLGHEASLANESWPSHDESMLRDEEIELPVQIMGKVRSRITVPADADAKTVEAAALADDRIAELLEGKTVRKVIVQVGRIVNIVAN